jgi:hypothetical protein
MRTSGLVGLGSHIVIFMASVASKGFVANSSVHQFFFRICIQRIVDAHVELAVIITGMMELVFTSDRCFEETGDSVKGSMLVIVKWDLEARHKLLPTLIKISKVVFINGIAGPMRASKTLLTWNGC